mmetsp:Transcript_72688/g.205540  ORF Transcript_72688/g.205540 Transcript_72688/m.205540 type:complete len:208 (-) Transcript_72688:133-756(-)
MTSAGCGPSARTGWQRGRGSRQSCAMLRASARRRRSSPRGCCARRRGTARSPAACWPCRRPKRAWGCRASSWMYRRAWPHWERRPLQEEAAPGAAPRWARPLPRSRPPSPRTAGSGVACQTRPSACSRRPPPQSGTTTWRGSSPSPGTASARQTPAWAAYMRDTPSRGGRRPSALAGHDTALRRLGVSVPAASTIPAAAPGGTAGST